MGGKFSKVPLAGVVTDAQRDYILVTNALKEHLQFNPAQSRLLAFGIDKQFHHGYPSLDSTVKLDALDVSVTLAREYKIKEFEVYTASDNPDQCTHAGIKSALESSAQRVGSEGLLVIFFGGHGVNDSNQEWALAPADFDLTPNTYLTTAMLNQCMERANCKAKHILVILDCCYSGAMAGDISKAISNNEVCPFPNTYILSAGIVSQKSTVITDVLRHSILSYFLKGALRRCPAVEVSPDEVAMPLKSIFEESQACCQALSSLAFSLDKDGRQLESGEITVTISFFNPTEAEDTDNTEGTDSSPTNQRLSIVMELLEKYRPIKDYSLHQETFQWLLKFAPGPLSVLNEKGLLNDAADSGRVLKTAIALMMQSVACIELVHNRASVNHPAVFLVAFAQVVATLDAICSGFPVKVQYLLEGWPLYHAVLVEQGIDDTSLKELYREMKEMEKKVSQ